MHSIHINKRFQNKTEYFIRIRYLLMKHMFYKNGTKQQKKNTEQNIRTSLFNFNLYSKKNKSYKTINFSTIPFFSSNNELTST